MKRITVVLLFFFLAVTALPAAQETAKEQAKPAKPEVTPEIKVQAPFTYNPEGRRDPFKDLLGGRELKDASANGEPQISVEDLILMGIVKNPKGYTAILGTTQGFPFFVRIGDKFSDGYVLSIDPDRVVFRKTRDRGLPLMRPRDVIKEINPEER